MTSMYQYRGIPVHQYPADMRKTGSAGSAACVRFVEAVSICLVSWDLFFGACHFCSFETVELAPFSNFLESCKQLLGVIEFLCLHFSPKRGYKVQIDVFVSILDSPKNRLCQNLVFYHV